MQVQSRSENSEQPAVDAGAAALLAAVPTAVHATGCPPMSRQAWGVPEPRQEDFDIFDAALGRFEGGLEQDDTADLMLQSLGTQIPPTRVSKA